ncbi:Chromosome 5 4 [Perkinsus olseni]|uniref:Chromosome 5 4 n=1 Tax=Perkinsus olseni TaxID=32597 RepID=A0A7J6MH31_PEROL|nr:Chromosome 5 4 [Perkinsus olseni]
MVLAFGPTILRRCAVAAGLDLNGHGTTGNALADAAGVVLLFLVLAEAPLPGPLVVTVAATLASIPMHVYGTAVKAMLSYVDEWSFMAFVVPYTICCTFWLTSTAAYVIEYFNLFPVEGRIIQPRRRLLPEDPKFQKLLRVCALNTIVLVPLIGMGSFYLQHYRDTIGLYVDMDPERLPSKLEIAVQMIYFILVNEFLFFYGHWLFHASPYLYKKIHKMHHEYPAPNVFASLYCHPLELVIADFVPLGAGAFCLGAHCYQKQKDETVKVYTKEEVEAHNKSDDCWIIVHGSVYDVTDFVESHPGGPEVITTISGGNVTEDFEEIGHSDEARRQAKAHRIGVLEGYEESKGIPMNSELESSGGVVGVGVLPVILIAGVAFVAYYVMSGH